MRPVNSSSTAADRGARRPGGGLFCAVAGRQWAGPRRASEGDVSGSPAIVHSLRIVAVILIVTLAWDALDPWALPSPIFVLASYFLLGFVCAAAFPGQVWLGIAIAIAAALLFEVLQSLVPYRDVREMELIGKWLAVSGGVMLELVLVFVRERRE